MGQSCPGPIQGNEERVIESSRAVAAAGQTEQSRNPLRHAGPLAVPAYGGTRAPAEGAGAGHEACESVVRSEMKW